MSNWWGDTNRQITQFPHSWLLTSICPCRQSSAHIHSSLHDVVLLGASIKRSPLFGFGSYVGPHSLRVAPPRCMRRMHCRRYVEHVWTLSGRMCVSVASSLRVVTCLWLGPPSDCWHRLAPGLSSVTLSVFQSFSTIVCIPLYFPGNSYHVP